MKKIVLLLSLAIITLDNFAQFRALERRNHNVNKLLKEISAFPDFKTAGFAFYALDIQSGETIASVNPDMALKPASTQKLLTTATILELLGPAHQFETTLEYSWKIDTVKKILH